MGVSKQILSRRYKMKGKDLEKTRKEIQELGLNALKDYFGIDIEEIDTKNLRYIHQRARVAMQFEREMGLSARAVVNNYLRTFKLIAEDKAELKKLIKKSLPMYLP